MRRLAVLAALLTLGARVPAAAQMLPSEPIALAGGRLVVGGDVSATFSCADSDASGSCADDEGFFNYTDYEHSAVRMLRIDVNASFAVSERMELLGEVRTENGDAPQPYAFYVRIRPWKERPIDIQVGRVPPTFGAFARRMYAADNLLIGYPLAYQYLTSLRADALPATGDELLRMRGRGWLSAFSVGNATPDNGVPLVSAFRWDTGVQVHAATGIVDGTLAVTTGTVGHPLVGDDNAGKQVAGRAVFHFGPALTAGVSAARGPFVARSAAESAGVAGGRTGRFTQAAWGGDVEYSRDYFLVRAEAIVSEWTLPALPDPGLDRPLRAASISVEGRYRILPGLYGAARFDHLGFSRVAGTSRTDAWEAPVSRIEVGGGYSIQRNLVLKLSFQHNTRRINRPASLNLTAAQAVFWF